MYEKLFHVITENLGTKLAIIALTGTTVASSGIAGYKIVKNFESARTDEAPIEIPNVIEIPGPDSSGNEGITENATGTGGASSTDIKKTNKTVVSGINGSTGATGTSGAHTSVNGICIVTIFGIQYDLTHFKHPKPIPLTCGGDMSSSFQGAHGTDVGKLARYKLTGSLTAQTGTTVSTSGSDDDTEEKEEKEHYLETAEEETKTGDSENYILSEPEN
jgi:hypothetical protein